MRDVNVVLENIEARGLLVNNLFQVHKTRWQCNLRTPSGETFAFATGKSAFEVLVFALGDSCNTDPAKRSRADELLE